MTCEGHRGHSWPGTRSRLRPLPGWTGRPTGRRFPSPARHRHRAHAVSGCTPLPVWHHTEQPSEWPQRNRSRHNECSCKQTPTGMKLMSHLGFDIPPRSTRPLVPPSSYRSSTLYVFIYNYNICFSQYPTGIFTTEAGFLREMGGYQLCSLWENLTELSRQWLEKNKKTTKKPSFYAQVLLLLSNLNELIPKHVLHDLHNHITSFHYIFQKIKENLKLWHVHEDVDQFLQPESSSFPTSSCSPHCCDFSAPFQSLTSSPSDTPHPTSLTTRRDRFADRLVFRYINRGDTDGGANFLAWTRREPPAY